MEEKATRKMSTHSFSNLSAAQVGAIAVELSGICVSVSLTSCFAPDLQMKAHCKHRGRPSALSSRLAKRVTHLKQKVAAQRGASTASMLHSREDEAKSDCRAERKGR